MNQPELAVLDQVEAFSYLAADPLFTDSQLHTLAGLADPAEALRGVVVDETATLGRRYAAVEAAAQGGWSGWMQRHADARVVASVLAHGMAQDQIHNRWGMPGQFVGPTGRILIGLPAGVREALEPLLADQRPLEIMGSQAATLQRANKYRICDLAGYLLAQREGVPWQDSPDPVVRDQSNAQLLGKPAAPRR
jgi:hypothetical protein